MPFYFFSTILLKRKSGCSVQCILIQQFIILDLNWCFTNLSVKCVWQTSWVKQVQLQPMKLFQISQGHLNFTCRGTLWITLQAIIFDTQGRQNNHLKVVFSFVFKGGYFSLYLGQSAYSFQANQCKGSVVEEIINQMLLCNTRGNTSWQVQMYQRYVRGSLLYQYVKQSEKVGKVHYDICLNGENICVMRTCVIFAVHFYLWVVLIDFYF